MKEIGDQQEKKDADHHSGVATPTWEELAAHKVVPRGEEMQVPSGEEMEDLHSGVATPTWEELAAHKVDAMPTLTTDGYAAIKFLGRVFRGTREDLTTQICFTGGWVYRGTEGRWFKERYSTNTWTCMMSLSRRVFAN